MNVESMIASIDMSINQAERMLKRYKDDGHAGGVAAMVGRLDQLREQRALLMKNVALPVIEGNGTLFLCGACRHPLIKYQKYCDECGQKLAEV